MLADSHQLLHLGIHVALSSVSEITLVETVVCPHQLRQLYRQCQPDVILLALNIVEPPCIEIVNNIQQQCPAAKILLLLHNPNEICLQQLRKTNVAGAILKSDTPEKLIEAIQTVAAGQPWFSSILLSQLLQSRKSEEGNKLTEREVTVLQLIAAEKTDREIALELNIAKSTVRYYLEQSNNKLGTTTRVGAVVEAMRQGFIQ